jgi:hypothetical protein
MPLLAAGCATATPPSSGMEDGGAGPVRFSDVSTREVVVRLAEPAHTAILDLRPGAPIAARWLTPGTRHLEPGAHTVALGGQAPRTRGDRAQRACNLPGETVVYSEAAAQEAAPANAREVNLGGVRFFCVRTNSGNRATDGGRMVLVVVSPQPVSDGLLEEVMAEFNREHGGVRRDGAALSRALGDMLAAEWPGSTAYHVRVPAS